MGCRITTNSSASSDEQEEASCGESSTLLENGNANGNGYGIERLSDSPSPERKAVDGGTTYAASATPDTRAAHPVQTVTPPPHERKPRRELVRSQEISSSECSSASERSLSRHTEPQVVRNLQRGNVREASRDWEEYNGRRSMQQPLPNNPLAGYPSHGRGGLARTQPFVDHMNQQNALKLGGPVEADGVIRMPRSSPTVYGRDSVKTQRGKEVMEELTKAYRWREQFDQPSQEFLALMDRLYMECQLHLTALSSRGDVESRREADAIVGEMVALRDHWGPQLLPSSTCNAFVRERIPLTLGVEQRQFRIDCAQFFEPVPFYSTQQSSCPGELMKLYRFSVYNVVKNEVVLRYYLERSNVIQLYHVLCFTCENYRGQVKPYGTEPPSYWEVRQNMLEDVYSRLLGGLSSTPNHQPPKPQTATVFAPNTMGRPAHIQVMPVPRNT